MGKTVETLSTLNSVARTFLAAVVMLTIGTGGWFGYRLFDAGRREAAVKTQELEEARTQLVSQRLRLEKNDRLLRTRAEMIEARDHQIKNQERDISRLDDEVERTQFELAKLHTAMQLLKVEKRLAAITITEQRPDPETGVLETTLEFVELDEWGKPLEEPRTFTIPGDVIYVDNWVVKFDDSYVEQSDELRSRSLVLFRRIFGNRQEPSAGFVIDQVGVRPKAYSRDEPLSDFEREIWSDFWTIANEPDRAAKLGIRAAHGEAVSMRVRKGRSYRLMLRSADGLSIVPAESPPAS